MLANKITVDNDASVISIGTATGTDVASGNIKIVQEQDIKSMVISFTHELTNRKNIELLRKAESDVQKTPALRGYYEQQGEDYRKEYEKQHPTK